MTKCTLNKHGRTLWRWEHAEVLDEMRARLLREPEKLALRKRIVEHPLGLSVFFSLGGLGKLAEK